MKRYLLALAVLLFLIAIISLRTLDTDRNEMLDKYTNQHSSFIGGESGLNVHYRDQGKRDGRPVIFLHGSSGSLHVFEPLIGKIRGSYRLISYDHPGHGLTGPHPSNDYSYAGYSHVLDLVLSELHIEKFVLVGHSMGGWIAWRYAAEHPDTVDALILISASGMPARKGDPAPRLSLGQRLMQTSFGRWLSEYTMPRSMIKSSSRMAIYDDDMVSDELVDQFWELMRFPGNRQAFSIRSQMSRDLHLAHVANEIEAPTLLIWGDRDTSVLPSTALSFNERIKRSEILILTDVGHLPMLEAPVDSQAAIEQFLDESLNFDDDP